MTAGTDQATVLHLSTSSGPGGAERMISTLAAALKDRRLHVIVGLFRPGWLQLECQRLGVQTTIMPLGRWLGLGWFLDCLRLVRAERVKLIHAHEFSAILCGWIVAILAGVPLVATVHGKNYFWEKARRRIAYRLVSRFGTLVAVSRDLQRFVVDKIGVDQRRVRVIYNGVTPMASVRDEEVRACKAELGIADRSPILGVVGSLYSVKGHKYMIEAMPEIIRAWPRAMLLVVGRGELEVSLKEQVERLTLGDSVKFLGMRQDVPRLLSVFDVFVLPSLSEGLSLALLEALSSGTPVVATAVGGNPEIIEHGQTGLLVKPEDSKDLAANLLTLFGQPGLMQQFSRLGMDRVQRHFGVARMADQYRDLYWNLWGAQPAQGIVH